ncbi:bifunctional DNA primase/polymerase [Streptomyces pathocidini]|uniref:Bifunctional DNA primase/polymerase n=1 Tax=Streptomyces pathocidini TaxID=1650571 RepID=A0ABW7UT08_9ACTN|nr:bifunctional DNA primase/polymerase [Streptomyces pathocidini]
MNVKETGSPTTTSRIPRQRTEPLADIAARYAEERHWDVLPGTWLEQVEGHGGSGAAERCSCGSGADCPAPGAHPARKDWSTQATGSAVVARRLWSKQPKASILLPTGRSFDALDVPESAGCLALARMERMEAPLGPIVSTPDRRMLFFVQPGAGAKVPGLVRKLGWSASSLDLSVRGEGDLVPAPPTRYGTPGAASRIGSAQWARQPTDSNRWLPDVEELISPLAYACGRESVR